MPYAYHQTEAYKELISSIQTYFEAKNIPVYTEPPEALYTFCSTEQKKTKKALMRSLCLLYPQLSFCYQKEMRNKNKYYVKLFEAVGVGTIHSQRLEGKRQ